VLPSEIPTYVAYHGRVLETCQFNRRFPHFDRRSQAALELPGCLFAALGCGVEVAHEAIAAIEVVVISRRTGRINRSSAVNNTPSPPPPNVSTSEACYRKC
jgi:hypothetical protein